MFSEESKSKKLAAARRKLKEYQQRGLNANNLVVASAATTNSATFGQNAAASELNSNGSNIFNNASEKSKLESQSAQPQINIVYDRPTSDNQIDFNENISADKSGDEYPLRSSEHLAMNILAEQESSHINTEDTQHISVMQVLIAEKVQLTNAINKYQNKCQQLELTLDELHTQNNTAFTRIQELQCHLKDKEQQAEKFQLNNNELQQKLNEITKANNEHVVHINELQQHLQLKDDRLLQTTTELKEKNNSLELAQLRIQQLSDEHNAGQDDRIDSLTKTKFMYEQQIRDLQAMLQQKTEDKEHANTQYLGYVQQLNGQINQLNERNSDLQDENNKLVQHESQLIKHIQILEKEIQKNINRQEQIKKDNENQVTDDSNQQQVAQLMERINALEDEIITLKSDSQTAEMQMKTHFDHVKELQLQLETKQNEIDQLNQNYEEMLADQPNQSKLLAAMESDKIAASRALSQNLELKKQLDELEARFVQLTNDKADLINRLDSEQYANREMQAKYNSMEEQLHTIENRFHCKDNEMIRLSNQNEELLQNNLILQQQIERMERDNEAKVINAKNNQMRPNETRSEAESETEPEPEINLVHHDHSAGIRHLAEHQHLSHEQHKCDHENYLEYPQYDWGYQKFEGEQHDISINNTQSYHNDLHHEAALPYNNHKQVSATRKSSAATTSTCQLASEEAVEKLQQRFTKLMSQVADLTEEKHRLEHLVLQLQGETETIGEYIALYQTQRRILKQREYEKAAETQMLQNERQQMHERLALLNRLVHSLGLHYPEGKTSQHKQVQIQPSVQEQQVHQEESSSQHFCDEQSNNSNYNVVPAINACSDNYVETTNLAIGPGLALPNQTNNIEQIPNNSRTALNLNFDSQQSQEILNQIQSIIIEIKENTKELPSVAQYQVKHNTVDHLNCCMGKFEVV